MKRTMLVFVLIVCLLAEFVLPTRAVGTDDLIREILQLYCHHQENARTDLLRLLEDLRAQDPVLAEDWTQILAEWQWVCTELTVSPGILPDGLPQDDSLCILVMGFALDYYGGIQEELLGRLQVALASAEKYPNAYILCTGGGTAYGNPYATEAGQMAGWLEDQGIDPARIIVENRSYSTELNAKYSMEILQRDLPQVDTLALVSSDYHLRRCHLLFQTVSILSGLEEGYTIAACAGYEAGYIGESGFYSEAESIGNLLGMYISTTAPALSQLTRITVSGETEYQPGDELGLTVTAEYDTGYTRDVTDLVSVSGFDPTVPGEQTVTVTYTENGVTAETSLSVTILEPPTEVTEAPTTAATTEPTLPPTEPPVTEESTKTDWIVPTVTGSVILLGAVLFLAAKRRPKGKYER